MCRSSVRDFCTLQKGKQHRFLCFLLFLSLYFNFFRALSYMYVFLFPQGVPLDLEVGYEKSVLTRTEILSGWLKCAFSLLAAEGNSMHWSVLDLCKLETSHGRVCNVLRGQTFTRNLWPSKKIMYSYIICSKSVAHVQHRWRTWRILSACFNRKKTTYLLFALK